MLSSGSAWMNHTQKSAAATIPTQQMTMISQPGRESSKYMRNKLHDIEFDLSSSAAMLISLS